MSAGFGVREAEAADFPAWGALRRALWPDGGDAGAVGELRNALRPARGGSVLLACDAAGTPVGFAEAALRHDYVNGTDSSPVAFLEGWYVAPAWRGRGAGRVLVDAVAAWARAQGCVEFASDALLDDAGAHAAHRACGFAETCRVAYFRKPLA